ncbi:ABC transporter permease [Streptomyces cadmiisoli]|uniref:ABC transporter permease n=1 Tax=Streptomyces cadmiisoli TaxID=2184053 RepID=A0A2Z4J165_9ACTN|nr:ABC transporter permease [Streptomyces cadmiisoli]AWW38849.1 ABC transporter permease [Streptomyces cadmiisoli]
MTTTLAEAPAEHAAPPDAPRRARVVLDLARFETRELLLQIPVFAFLVLYVGYSGWKMFSGGDADDFPVLHYVDRATQSRPLLLGVAVLVCANRAVLRSRRNGTDTHFDVLPLRPWLRTLAHALSVVPIALITALVVTLEFTWAALKPGSVGHGSVFELAVGPLTVLLCGVAGVLFARSVPSSFAAPLLVVGVLMGGTFLSATTSDARWQRWLWPDADETGAAPFPSDLLGRPAAWHALYLTGLIVLLGCAALLVSGGRTRTVAAVTVAALAATGAGVAGQSAAEPPALLAARTKASVTPEKLHTCVPHGASRYCAFPEWSGRTADWAEVVDRVQGLAGGTAARERLTVRQRVEARYGLRDDAALTASRTPGEVTVGTEWGGNRVPEFAVGVASVLVAGSEEAALEVCDARVVTVMWLALGAEKDPMSALRNVRLDDSVEGSALALAPTNPVGMSAEQTRIVVELLQRPRGEVAGTVRANWTELTSPRTSPARAAQLLGVRAPAQGVGAGDSCD